MEGEKQLYSLNRKTTSELVGFFDDMYNYKLKSLKEYIENKERNKWKPYTGKKWCWQVRLETYIFVKHSCQSVLNLNASLLLLIGTYGSMHYLQEYQIKKQRLKYFIYPA